MSDPRETRTLRYGAKRLVINQCPTHRWYAVTIDDTDGGGIRVTPSKCCGRWDTVKSFALNKRGWTELSELASQAAETCHE